MLRNEPLPLTCCIFDPRLLGAVSVNFDDCCDDDNCDTDGTIGVPSSSCAIYFGTGCGYGLSRITAAANAHSTVDVITHFDPKNNVHSVSNVVSTVLPASKSLRLVVLA